MALRFEDVQREDDVMRRKRRSIVKAHLLAQEESISQLVGRDPDLFGDKAVKRVRFVAIARHQRVEDRAHAGRAVTL